METKGIILWAILLAVVIGGFIYFQIKKKRIREEGIEAIGEISRIDENWDPDDGSVTETYYVRFQDENGNEHEAQLLNRCDFGVGTRVQIKYRPKDPRNALLLGAMDW